MTHTTVQFDHHADDFADDPYATYRALSHCPVAWTESWGGFWVVTGYDEVFRAAQDDTVFLSGAGVSLPVLSTKESRAVPIEADAPDAQRFRAVVQHAMAPAAITELEPHLRVLIANAIDAFIETGRCDFMADLAMPVPARFILDWVGFDADDWQWFTGRIHDANHGMALHPDHAFACYSAVAGAISAEIETRHNDPPRQDLLGLLLASDLTDDEVANFAYTLVNAGLDTTMGALGNSLITLDRQRDLRQQLIDDPSKISTAVEELLRYQAPLQCLARVAARDIELGGQHIRAGERVLLSWGAANRDARQFGDPDSVVFDREANRHLAFGVGLHRCLGSNIARLTLRLELQAILDRLPDYRIDHPDAVERFEDAGIVFAPRHLRAGFTPGPKLNQ